MPSLSVFSTSLYPCPFRVFSFFWFISISLLFSFISFPISHPLFHVLLTFMIYLTSSLCALPFFPSFFPHSVIHFSALLSLFLSNFFSSFSASFWCFISILYLRCQRLLPVIFSLFPIPVSLSIPYLSSFFLIAFSSTFPKYSLFLRPTSHCFCSSSSPYIPFILISSALLSASPLYYYFLSFLSYSFISAPSRMSCLYPFSFLPLFSTLTFPISVDSLLPVPFFIFFPTFSSRFLLSCLPPLTSYLQSLFSSPILPPVHILYPFSSALLPSLSFTHPSLCPPTLPGPSFERSFRQVLSPLSV